MPGPVLTLSSVVMCSHAGGAQPLMPSPRLLLTGAPAVTIASPYAVAGCGLSAVPSPPCVTGQWTVGAARVLSGGVPLAVMTGVGTCVPTGQPLLAVSSQPRVVVT